jgi:DNA-binding NtrC family response regulator
MVFLFSHVSCLPDNHCFRGIIRRALVWADGNRARAAERLGIRRQLLYDKIARYGLDESPKRTDGVPKEDRSD